MTVTAADPRGPGRLRAALALTRYAARMILRPSTPVPALHLSVPVPPGPRAARDKWLSSLAAQLGTGEQDRGSARVVTGELSGVKLTARLHDDGYTRKLRPLPGRPSPLLTGSEIGAVCAMAAGHVPGGAS